VTDKRGGGPKRKNKSFPSELSIILEESDLFLMSAIYFEFSYLNNFFFDEGDLRRMFKTTARQKWMRILSLNVAII